MNRKTIITLSILFIILAVLTFAVKFYAPVSQIDMVIISKIQAGLSFIPLKYPVFADKTGYIIIAFLGLSLGALCLALNKNWKQIPVFVSIPFAAFILNRLVIKTFIQRPRPDMDLQISWVHPQTFSYVSTHTLITFCLFGMIVYYLYKRCKNNFIKYTGMIFSVLWIILTGLSRVWLGVHYPTDILGACILGSIILIFYVELSNYIERI